MHICCIALSGAVLFFVIYFVSAHICFVTGADLLGNSSFVLGGPRTAARSAVPPRCQGPSVSARGISTCAFLCDVGSQHSGETSSCDRFYISYILRSGRFIMHNAFYACPHPCLKLGASAAPSFKPRLCTKSYAPGRTGPFHSDLLLNVKAEEPSSSADCTSGP